MGYFQSVNFFIFVLLICGSAHSRAVHLNDLWNRALDQREEIKNSRIETQRRSEISHSALSEFFPVVNSQVSSTHSSSSGNTFNTQLLLTQPLDFLWVQKPKYSKALQELEIAKIEENKIRASVAKEVLEFALENTFYLQEIELYSKLLDLQKEIVKTTHRKVKIGSESDLSALSASSNYELLESQKIEKEASYSYFKKRMETYFKDTDLELKTIPLNLAKFKEMHKTLNEWRSQGKALSFESQTIEKELNVLQLQTRIEMTEHAPRLDLVGGWGFSNPGYFNVSRISDTQSHYWGLQLSLPLFSGLSSFHDRKAKALAHEKLRNRMSLELIESQNNLTESIQKLALGISILERYQSIQEKAQRSERIADRMYSLGTLSYFQFSDLQKKRSETDLAQIRQLRDLSNTLYLFIETYPLEIEKIFNILN